MVRNRSNMGRYFSSCRFGKVFFIIFISLTMSFGISISVNAQSIENSNTSSEKIFTNSTIILSNILNILKDSLVGSYNLIREPSVKPLIMRNSQIPLGLRILIEDNQLFLVYACNIMKEMVTDTKSYQYLIPIASLKDEINTLFAYSKKKKLFVFNYNGSIEIGNNIYKQENITVKITTKLSDTMFQKVVDDFHKMGL